MVVKVNKLISLEEAQGLALAAAAPLATEKVQLEDGSGRVLAEEVRALRDEPPVTQAAMDGYAVHSEDVDAASSEKPVFLAVVGTVGPGQHLDQGLQNFSLPGWGNLAQVDGRGQPQGHGNNDGTDRYHKRANQER